MVFSVETTYDQKTMTAMVRAVRKTVRKKRSKRSHTFGVLAILLALILALSASEITFRLIVTLLAAVVILIALIWEDSLNAYFARRNGLPGLEKSTVTFQENGYHSVTAVGESDFPYGPIQRLARCGDYLVFVFGPKHAQIYDLRTLTGGTISELTEFLTAKTGLHMEYI